MAKLKFLKRILYSDIHSLQDDSSAFFYESGLMIDADGAYHAYHPDKKSGRDYLGNAGRPGNWWALVTDNGKPSGNPVIQSKSDPAPLYWSRLIGSLFEGPQGSAALRRCRVD